MTIIDTLLRPFAKAFTPESVPFDSSPFSLSPVQWRDDADYSRSIGDGGGTSLVGAIINWELRRFPEATLEVRKRVDGDWQPQAPHELTDMIRRPNPGYSGSALWAGFIISRLLDGNVYWLKVRNGATRLVELWYVPHFQIEPRGGNGIFIDHYEWNIGGHQYKVPPSEIWHYRRGIDTANPRKGCSEIKEQLREIYTDEEAARFTATMLHNFGVPGLILSPKDGANNISPDDADVLVAKIDAKLQGSGRGKTSFMSNAVDIKTISWSPAEMALGDMRNIPEERVSAATGIPAAVVGFGTGLEQTKVGATMSEMREMAIEDAIVPLWRDAADQMEDGLLSEFTGGDTNYGMHFDTSDVRVLQPDRDKLHARTMGDFNGGLIPSQVAEARLGYPVTAERNVYHIPINVIEVPVGEVAPPRAEPGKALGMKTAANELAFLRILERGQEPIAQRYATSLAKVFDELGQMAERAYSAAPKAAKVLVGANGAKVAEPVPEDEALTSAILGPLNLASWADSNIRPIYQAEYRATGLMVIGGYEQLLGADLAIGVRDTVAEQLIREGGRRAGLYDLEANTRSALLRALTEARAEGLGIPETGRRIREYVPAGRYVDAGAKYRAEMIARTETRYATNVSVAKAGRAAGFDQWRIYDNRTSFGDSQCSGRDGELVSYDDMLSIAGEEHVNGTMSAAPVPRT